jgi:hypothetical protein
MSDITVIVAGPSTSLVLMEFEINEVVNEFWMILWDIVRVVRMMIVTVLMIRLD